MSSILKTLLVIIIVIMLIAVGFLSLTTQDDSDTKAPQITTILGDISVNQTTTVDITVNFTDNEAVTSAILYYRQASETTWKNVSILSGSYSLFIPSSPDDWYYYIVIDDDAGNGPIGDPSTDGSSYYTIEVANEQPSNGDEDFIPCVFIEEGTQTTCRYCTWAADALHELYTSDKYNMYYVSMVDDENDLAAQRIQTEYNIKGYPTVFFDGGYKVYSGGLYEGSSPRPIYEQYLQESLARDKPKIGLNITTAYDNATNLLSATILINNHEDTAYTGEIRVYITEKISRWNDYNGSKYHFGFIDYLLRQEMTIEPNMEEDLTSVYDASDLDPENLMIIAVVYSSSGTQAYADPTNQDNPFTAYYADACDGTEVIEGGNLPPEVGITFPIPGQIYFRGRQTLKLITTGINLIRNTTTLAYTWLFGKTTIQAYAEDDSAVAYVEFYLNDELVFNDSEAPYEFAAQKLLFKTPLLLRQYTILVRAVDDQGKSSSSSIDVFAWRAFVY